MRESLKNLGLIIAFLFLVVIFLSSPTFAQTTTSGFVLSPPFAKIILEKEASQPSYFIEITNKSGVFQTLRLSVVDFGSLDESGGVAFLGLPGEKLERKYSLASWVSLEKDTLGIESRKSGKVKITILNKESLSPGGHYAAVVVTADSEKEERKNVSFNTALSSLIFVKKTGGEIYQLNLAGKEITSRLLGFPIKIALRFQNSGNIHLVPRGTITITDPKGTMISKGVINQESGIILPESFRIYPTTLNNLAFPLLPGTYFLNIDYRYEEKKDFIHDSRTFFFPGIAGIIILIIMIVIVSLIFIHKFRINRKSVVTTKKFKE